MKKFFKVVTVISITTGWILATERLWSGVISPAIDQIKKK